MASSPAKKFSLLLLFTLLSYTRTQARDNQLFSKVSASAIQDQELPLNNNQQEEPNFIQRENENGYGLYGHDQSGQLPPSATGTSLLNTESEAPLHRHLPKNYNPEAYVTKPEGYTSDGNQNSYTTNLKNYYREAEKSYNNQQEDEETTSEPEQYIYNHNYRYYGGSSFNSERPQGLRDYRLSGRDPAQNSRENYFYNGGADSVFQPQGMSDTRSLENGKYFYDINTEKYSNHPYAVLNKANNIDYSERSYYGASENSMRASHQNQYDFQDEGNIP
ncbi:uncharacterized protein [Primulina huaijiensis]|uniref:uncharacterized protein n=1 Tax=Primulina huaijiensis TaxID=1492673 RepID=UPI003CC79ACE